MKTRTMKAQPVEIGFTAPSIPGDDTPEALNLPLVPVRFTVRFVREHDITVMVPTGLHHTGDLKAQGLVVLGSLGLEQVDAIEREQWTARWVECERCADIGSTADAPM